MSTTWINRGHFYVPHVTPVLVDCNFVVDATNGLGITSLKGQGVQNVFMHTSTTPATGNNGFVNPNPANGLIVVQLADNFNRLYSSFSQVQAPVTGSALAVNATALTVGVAYQITVLGGATAADWVALGVPRGVTAAVGVSFVALATGAGSDAVSKVKAIGNSGVSGIEVVGNPNLSINPVPVGGTPHVGGWLLLQCLGSTFTAAAYTPAGTISVGVIPVATGTAGDAVTNNAGVLNSVGGQDVSLNAQTFTGTAASLSGTITQSLAAPTASSVISLAFYLSQSSVVVAGE